MIATDLMIGDWVKPSCWNEQVLLVGEGRVTVKSDSYTEDEIKPIPLTEEILESNGFVRDDKHEYSMTGSNYNYLKVRCYADTYFEIGNAFDEEGELQAFADIQYVHELQHALKLCGIDKNIEL